MAEEGWTLVRRGRRRQRQPTDDRWYRADQRWVDRAPPFSGWRRDHFPQPNRPAPPPRAARYTGPQSRSYADVFRRAYPRPAGRRVPPRRGDSRNRQEPTDPQFGKLVRTLYAVVRMVHHLQNVSTKTGAPDPRTISRMIDVLTNMIKPAAPTQRTRDMIRGNAINWGHTTRLALQQHYEAGIENLMEELTELLTPEWKAAFEVAIRWAKRNLPNITKVEIDHAEAMITAKMADRDPVQRQNPQRVEVPTQTQAPQKPPEPNKSVATMTDQPVQVPDGQQGISWVETPRDHRVTKRVATRPRRVLLEDYLPQDQLPRRVLPGDLSPQEQEVEVFVDAEELGTEEIPVHASTQANLEALFEEDPSREYESGEEADAQTPQTVGQISPVPYEDAQEEDVFEESFDRFTAPEPQRYRVYRHPNTQRKLTDWDLVVHRKWLIIGDSNLCSLPDYFSIDLQVESYPGAHFRHAQALMQKTRPRSDLVVEKIILSFGINSRGNKCKETTVKNLQGALRSTKNQFPYAVVYIPLVNFSQALPAEERENLQVLNEHIERNMSHIPLLPEDLFEVEADDLHWTADTGSAMLSHWMRALNSRSP